MEEFIVVNVNGLRARLPRANATIEQIIQKPPWAAEHSGAARSDCGDDAERRRFEYNESDGDSKHQSRIGSARATVEKLHNQQQQLKHMPWYWIDGQQKRYRVNDLILILFKNRLC